MTALTWPAPGTTYGPDRLDEVRVLLRAWPGRGVWACHPEIDRLRGASASEWDGWDASSVCNSDVWTMVRDVGQRPSDPPDTKPAEAARTVEVSVGWTFYVRDYEDGPGSLTTWPTRDDAARGRAYAVNEGRSCGPVVEVRAALPLPTEPAVVVGEVVDAT